MKLDRKEFLKTALTMVGFGFAVTRVAACGGDSPGGTGAAGTGGGGNACEANAPNETIGTNHGHELTVSQADVAAGVAKTYGMQGTSAHDHMVTISAASFATLKAGGTLNLTSTTGSAHEHTVKIVCA